MKRKFNSTILYCRIVGVIMKCALIWYVLYWVLFLCFLLGTWHDSWFMHFGSMKTKPKLTKFNVNTFFFLQLRNFIIDCCLRVCIVHSFEHSFEHSCMYNVQCKLYGLRSEYMGSKLSKHFFFCYSVIKLITIIENDYQKLRWQQVNYC